MILQGEKSFFSLPGEKLEQGIQDVFILGEDEGLILKANEAFIDVDEKEVNGVFNIFIFYFTLQPYFYKYASNMISLNKKTKLGNVLIKTLGIQECKLNSKQTIAAVNK